MYEAPVQPQPINFVEIIHQPTWKNMLLGLVKSTKMDPWDIDVSLLAEKFLEKINELDGTSLRIPANAILCSAILLKHKSKALKISSIEEDDDEDDFSNLTADQIREREKLFLCEGLPTLNPPRLMREGKVSLDDLVSSIESILNQSKRKRILAKNKKVLEFQIPWAEKNIEDKLDFVFDLVKQTVDEEGLVMFSRLIDGKTNLEIVHTFLPLLFLHNQNKLNMLQEEFFGEIFISLNSDVSENDN